MLPWIDTEEKKAWFGVSYGVDPDTIDFEYVDKTDMEVFWQETFPILIVGKLFGFGKNILGYTRNNKIQIVNRIKGDQSKKWVYFHEPIHIAQQRRDDKFSFRYASQLIFKGYQNISYEKEAFGEQDYKLVDFEKRFGPFIA